MAAKNKAHFVFPSDLLEDIDKLVGRRKRNKFVVEATKKELKRIKLIKALEAAAGSWEDKDHPEIVEKGTYEWIRELREKDNERLKWIE